MIDDFVSEPFDLATDVPIRFALHRIGDRCHELVVVAHHIALDGLSFAPLIADLTAAYTARRAGATPAWAPSAGGLRGLRALAARTAGLGDP
ncbi:hypothetical protein GS416_08670 [Rhodococcus hoagii]|nr:hypothetical protein [Prescottella equi]